MPWTTTLRTVQIMPRPAVDLEPDPFPEGGLEGVESLRVVSCQLLKLIEPDVIALNDHLSFFKRTNSNHYDLRSVSANVTWVTVEAESTTTSSQSPAVTLVVQPDKVVSSDLRADERVGLADAVILEVVNNPE